MNRSVKLQHTKVYEAPKLLKYGSLTDMTAANHLRGKMDARTGSTKTG